MSIARPDLPGESPSGPVSSAEAIDGLPFENVSAEATPDARLQRPRHALRHVGGKFRKEGYGNYETVTMTYLPDVRDRSVLHSPVSKAMPSAADRSGDGPVSQEVATSYGRNHLCGGGNCGYCYPQAFFNQIQEFGQ